MKPIYFLATLSLLIHPKGAQYPPPGQRPQNQRGPPPGQHPGGQGLGQPYGQQPPPNQHRPPYGQAPAPQQGGQFNGPQDPRYQNPQPTPGNGQFGNQQVGGPEQSRNVVAPPARMDPIAVAPPEPALMVKQQNQVDDVEKLAEVIVEAVVERLEEDEAMAIELERQGIDPDAYSSANCIADCNLIMTVLLVICIYFP